MVMEDLPPPSTEIKNIGSKRHYWLIYVLSLKIPTSNSVILLSKQEKQTKYNNRSVIKFPV